eukprot:9745-Heterococcus_DN1.PRE.4
MPRASSLCPLVSSSSVDSRCRSRVLSSAAVTASVAAATSEADATVPGAGMCASLAAVIAAMASGVRCRPKLSPKLPATNCSMFAATTAEAAMVLLPLALLVSRNTEQMLTSAGTSCNVQRCLLPTA